MKRGARDKTGPVRGLETVLGGGLFLGKATIARFRPARKPRAAARSTLPALAEAREELGRDEEGLEERPRREAACERAEERGRAGGVGEPPDVLHEGEAVHVDVVGRDHLQETQTPVRAPEAALL